MTKVNVEMLGKFEICVDGKDIVPELGNSKKKLAILQYLILNKGNAISNFSIFEDIWPGEANTNPESSLKTLISRLRQSLKDLGIADGVVTKQGSYCWNDQLNEQIDIFEFEKLCNKVLTHKNTDEEMNNMMEEMLSLYQGDLLAGYDTQTWIVSKSMYYHNNYVKCLHLYIELLKKEKRYIQIMQVARKGLEIDKFDSTLNLELMEAMLALDMKNEAMAHYNYTVNLHYTQLGVTPSTEILLFYKNLVRLEKDANASLDTIREELQDGEQDNSAFVCNYSIFKDIYQLNVRNLHRLNVTIFLGVITITPFQQHKDTNLLLLNKVMEQFLDTLKKNLRKGDTISRYGPSQFAILLPAINYKTGALAIERVKKAFYSNNAAPEFVISYKLKPLTSDK